MELLVTGDYGHVGRNLSTPHRRLPFREPSQWPQILTNCPKPFSILHLAAVTGPAAEQDYQQINVCRTLELAQIALDFGVKRFYFASSGHVYGKVHRPANESQQLSPISMYAKSKSEAEQSLSKLFGSSDSSFRLHILRIFSLLDFGMKSSTLGSRFENVLVNPELKIMNALDERNFLTPSQAARLIDKVLVAKELPHILNICSDTKLSVEQACKYLARSAGKITSPSMFDQSTSDLPYNLGDNSLLKTTIGIQHLDWLYLSKYISHGGE